MIHPAPLEGSCPASHACVRIVFSVQDHQDSNPSISQSINNGTASVICEMQVRQNGMLIVSSLALHGTLIHLSCLAENG
jgi:hypothetical protein